jgi:hypothetical protein
MLDWDRLTAHYTSGSGDEYFGWSDSAHHTPSRLAGRFIEQFPNIVEEGRGRDWLYVGWYQEMLGLTYPDVFPIAYADWDLPADCLKATGETRQITIPMPPFGEGVDSRWDI